MNGNNFNDLMNLWGVHGFPKCLVEPLIPRVPNGRRHTHETFKSGEIAYSLEYHTGTRFDGSNNF